MTPERPPAPRSAPGEGASLRIVGHDGRYGHAVWKNTLLLVWRQAAPVSAVHVVRDEARRLELARPGRIYGLLTVIEENTGLPDAAARAALAEVMNIWTPTVRAATIVHEGDGFGAAAVRSVITGIDLAARHPFPSKIFRSVAQAASWLAPQVNDERGEPIDPAALVAIVAAFRARIAAVAR